MPSVVPARRRAILGVALTGVLAASALIAGAAPAEAAVKVSPLTLLITSDPSDQVGFEAGQSIVYTYTITNPKATSLDTGSIPEAYIDFKRAVGSAAPVVAGDCDSDNSFDEDGIFSVGVNLPETMTGNASLTCTLTYTATADDVDNSGLWTQLTYRPTGPTPGYSWWYWYTNPSVGHSENPTIDGTLVFGSTLTATPGVWGPGTLTYQWYRGTAKISGAKNATYVLQAADVGQTIRVAVHGSKDYDSTYLTRFSPSTSAIAGLPLTSGDLTVSGTPTVGKKLTVASTAWAPSGTALSYQWLRNGKAISKATKSSYILTSADAGKSVSVRVTGTKAGYTRLAILSDPLEIGKAFTKATAPKVTGTPTVGQTLIVKLGTFAPALTGYEYGWMRDGSFVTSDLSYPLTNDDLGHEVWFEFYGGRDGYTTLHYVSTHQLIGNPFDTVGVPSIDGTPTVGQVLTAQPGEWAPIGTEFTYQWTRNGVNISGATADHYTAKSADAGTTLAVKVTGSATGYTPQTATSAGVKVGKAFTKSPVPTITGLAEIGAKLTAKAGTWSPTAKLSYQWLSNGFPIEGATASTYVVSGEDAGDGIQVRVTAKATGYTTTSRTSAGLEIPGSATS